MRVRNGLVRGSGGLWAVLFIGSLVVGSATGGGSQTGMGGTGAQFPHGEQGDAKDTGKQDPGMARLQEQQAKSRNDDRQRRLVDDTAKLYVLAGELKEEVAKSDKNKLSLDVIKKADAIEHLAHSVKDRMKG